MRTLLSLILAACLLTVSLIAVAGEPDEKLHKRCLYPTVLVHPVDIPACGSGVIVKSEKQDDGTYQNVVISCGHVALAYEDKQWSVGVANYDSWSDFQGYTEYPCMTYAADEEMDLAVLVFVSKTEMPVAELGLDEKLYIGNDAMGIGCGLGDIPRVEFGKITSPKTDIGNIKNCIRTSMHTLPGDSGSPLFHNNRVVGIRQAIRVFRGIPVFNMSYSVPITRLKLFDDDCKGALAFVYKSKGAMPAMPFFELKMQQYQVVNPPKDLSAKNLFEKKTQLQAK